jgi:hypothetical protein
MTALWLCAILLYLPFYMIKYATFAGWIQCYGSVLSGSYFAGACFLGYLIARTFPPARRVSPRHLLFASGCALALVACTRVIQYYALKPTGIISRDVSLLQVLRLGYTPYTVSYYITLIAASHAIFYYVSKLNSENAAAMLAAELTRAQVRSLEAQLHPHFLFNALNSISAYVREDPDRAIDAADRLKQLFLAVHDPRLPPFCLLETELDLVRSYLALEQLRHGRRLRFVVAVETTAQAVLVPRLLLQPVVENAVRHGVARASGNCFVAIIGYLHSGTLTIIVRDNGAGLEPSYRIGIGIGNTQRRLERLYSHSAVELQRMSSGGTEVLITFPAQETLRV